MEKIVGIGGLTAKGKAIMNLAERIAARKVRLAIVVGLRRSLGRMRRRRRHTVVVIVVAVQ